MWVVASSSRWRGPYRRGGDAGVYTDRPKWPLGAVLGHLCTLLRCEDRASNRVGTQECTQIGENGLPTPFRGTCVHCCAVADNRGYARVYTDRLKRTLDAVLGHLCTLLRRDSPRRQPARTPEEPKMFPDWRSRRGRRTALYARDRQLLSSSTSSRMSSMAASGLVCGSE